MQQSAHGLTCLLEVKQAIMQIARHPEASIIDHILLLLLLQRLLLPPALQVSSEVQKACIPSIICINVQKAASTELLQQITCTHRWYISGTPADKVH